MWEQLPLIFFFTTKPTVELELQDVRFLHTHSVYTKAGGIPTELTTQSIYRTLVSRATVKLAQLIDHADWRTVLDTNPPILSWIPRLPPKSVHHR